MDLIRNFKIHAAALIIVVLAELVGVQKFGLVVLLPLLYALVFGALVSFPRWSVVRLDEMNRAGKMLSVGVLLLITKIALDIGPNIEMIMQSGWALIMQEFGHFFGTLIFGLPVALLVGMKREAIGACYSIDREPNVAIISERFGLDSPEWACMSAERSSARFGCRFWPASLLRWVSSIRMRLPWAPASAAPP